MNTRMNLSDFYAYIFEGRAKINLDKVPDSLREKRKSEITNTIKKKFEFITSSKTLTDSFRRMLAHTGSQDLEKILYGSNQELKEEIIQDESQFPSDNAIKEKYKQLEGQYGHFPEEKNASAQFIVLFKACKLIADYVECNSANKNDAAYLHAYKLLIFLGGNLKKIDDYINQYMSGIKKPVHDLLIFPIPKLEKGKSVDLVGWRKLISKTPTAIRYFQQALAIEAILKNAPTDMKEAENASSKITYARSKENPELAELCVKYQHTEDDFNRCLSITPKKTDNLPTLSIDGNALNQPSYYLVKLPTNDPRAFLLGDITHCCQSIGGDSEQCVIDGITLKNNGFYVLLKSTTAKETESKSLPPLDKNNKIDYQHYLIVGQGYAYFSDTNNFVFDSWENLTPAMDDEVIAALLPEFAKQLIEEKESDILRVTIGLGGKTPSYFRKQRVAQAETIREGHQYPDSFQQGLIYINKGKEEKLRETVKEKIMHYFTDTFPIEIIQKLEIMARDENNLKILNQLHFSHKMDSAENVGDIGCLFLLARNGILEKERAQSILYLNVRQRDFGDIFYATLLMLHLTQLLNDKRCDLLLSFFENYADNYNHRNAHALVAILEGLYTTKCLDEENLSLLIKAKDHIWNIREAISVIFKINITPYEPYFKLFCASPQTACRCAYALELLKNADMLTDANTQIIVRFHAKNDVRAMANIMILLEKEKILDENRNLLSDYLEKHNGLEDELEALTKNKINTCKNILYILKNPSNAAGRAKILVCLGKVGILSEQHIALLAQHTENISMIEQVLIELSETQKLTNDTLKATLNHFEKLTSKTSSVSSSSSSPSSTTGMFSSTSSTSSIVNEVKKDVTGNELLKENEEQPSKPRQP